MRSAYIHIPFCKNICTYCDFSKVYYKSSLVRDYLKALEDEINEYYFEDKLYSLYIGGGTPSCLMIEDLKYLFEVLNKFDLTNLQEFTIECNVEDINEKKLKLFKKHNVTRLSIGLQTFNKNLLTYLGRDSNIDIKDKLLLAKKYFDNINVDLIYAIPNQTIDDLEMDLNNLLKLEIPHISTYSLIIEEHTKLYLNKISAIDDDLDYRMYDFIRKKLNENDYIHYELSNFAKRNHQSKHNLVYWNNQEYYGFGLGSHGYIDNIRYENTRSISKYLHGKYRFHADNLSKQETIENELILGFRKISGINKNHFFNKYGIDIKEIYGIKEHLKTQKLLETKNQIYINPNYLYTMNDILINFIDGGN